MTTAIGGGFLSLNKWLPLTLLLMAGTILFDGCPQSAGPSASTENPGGENPGGEEPGGENHGGENPSSNFAYGSNDVVVSVDSAANAASISIASYTPAADPFSIPADIVSDLAGLAVSVTKGLRGRCGAG
jgi:hypothetical protein